MSDSHKDGPGVVFLGFARTSGGLRCASGQRPFGCGEGDFRVGPGEPSAGMTEVRGLEGLTRAGKNGAGEDPRKSPTAECRRRQGEPAGFNRRDGVAWTTGAGDRTLPLTFLLVLYYRLGL